MKTLKQYLLLILFISITGFSAALSLKAAIGVGPWDALAQSISYLTPFKIGTIGMMLNITCVLGQLIILRRDFKLKMFLQIAVSVITGSIVNFFYYNVLSGVVITSYVMRIVLLLVSNVIVAISVGGIMELDIVIYPLEGICLAFSKKFNLRFTHLRQLLDVLNIVLVLILSFTFSIPLTIREGTIISMLVFSPLLFFFIPKMKSVIDKIAP